MATPRTRSVELYVERIGVDGVMEANLPMENFLHYLDRWPSQGPLNQVMDVAADTVTLTGLVEGNRYFWACRRKAPAGYPCSASLVLDVPVSDVVDATQRGFSAQSRDIPAQLVPLSDLEVLKAGNLVQAKVDVGGPEMSDVLAALVWNVTGGTPQSTIGPYVKGRAGVLWRAAAATGTVVVTNGMTTLRKNYG